MPIRFIPTGQLDITTDPTMLPEQAVGEKLVASDALTRCTNLRLGHKGMARNRWGSSKVNAAAIDTDVNFILEHNGDRYEFTGDKIYKNEVVIGTGFTAAEWSAIIYNQYNSEIQSIFSLNGTDRKRITADTIYEWGTDAPANAPAANPTSVCTHDWETDYISGCALWGITAGNYQTSNNWEAAFIDEGDVTIPPALTAAIQVTTEGLCTPGKHLVAVSYETDNGETELGIASNEITVDSSNTKIDLTSIPTGSANVVARKIYMTKADNAGATTDMAAFLISYAATTTDVALTGVTSPISLNDSISVEHPISGWAEYTIEAILVPWAAEAQTVRLSSGLAEAVLIASACKVTYATYWLVDIIRDNTTTTYTVDIVDADLGESSQIIHYQNFAEPSDTSSFADTDVYGVKYTYVRKEDDSVVFESSPSEAGSYTIVATSDSKPMIVFFKRTTDDQITHIRLYRTLDAAGVYYYDSEVDIKRGQALLTRTDAQLGAEVDSLDHTRPPLGSFVLGPNYGGISFILKDNLVYFSATSRPEYWPEDYYVEASTKDYPLISGTFLDTQLYVGSKNDIYLITVGTGAITSKSIGAITGTQAKQVFMGVKGHGLFHLGIDGLYQLTGSQYQPLYQGEGSDNNITNLNLRQLFEGETVGTITGMNKDAIANCFLVVFKSKVFFAYPGLGSTYCDNMLVFGLIHKKVVHYQYPVAFRTAAVDYMNQRLLAADESGYIWHIEDMTLTTDEGTAIAWKIQSKDFTLFKKMFPRTARYDVEVGTSATGYILLNGVSKQTHTLTGDRRNRRRLIDGCNGDRLSIRLEGTGEVKIHKVEVE